MNKDRILLSSIYFLFHAGLMAYKLFHPLWFYEQGKLEYFAVGYAFMALGGILSRFGFIYIKKSYRVTSLLLSSLLIYSLGVIISSFTSNIWYSIIGGVLTGASANNIIQVLYRVGHSKEDRHQFNINKGIVVNFAQFVGVLGTAILLSLVNFHTSPSLFGIHISNGLVLLTTLPLLGLYLLNKHFKNMEFIHNDPFSLERIKDLCVAYPYLVCFTLSISFLGGLFMNILLPFIPVIFKEQGFTLLTTGLIVSFSYLAGSILYSVADKYNLVKNKVLSFGLAHLIIVLSCAGLSYFNSPILIGLSMCLYFMMVSYRQYSLMLIENQIFARHIVPSFKSLDGTVFFISNIVGGCLGYYLYENFNKETVLLFSGTVALVSGALSLFFVYRNMVYMYNLHLEIQASKRNIDYNK